MALKPAGAAAVRTREERSEPIVAVAPYLSEQSGISGLDSLTELVEGIAATAWPWVSVGVGAILALAGVAVIVTSARWPSSGRCLSSLARCFPHARI